MHGFNMELSITNYIVISITNYADEESDDDEEKNQVKNVYIHGKLSY